MPSSSSSLPFFKKGSFLHIQVRFLPGSVSSFSGICLDVSYSGFNSYFLLHLVLNNRSVVHKFPLFSPFLSILPSSSSPLPPSNPF